MTTDRSNADLHRLVALVERLRAPDGCPWDRKQGLGEVRAYLLEEAHELAEAVDSGDWGAIGEELGDLLFQAAFVARLGEEAGALTAADAIAGIHAKMVERHPHVFGEAAERLPDAAAVARAWERRKLAAAPEGEPARSLLAGVPTGLPALLAAYRMTQKAAGIGFDWPDAADVVAKVREELAELEAEIVGITPPSPGPFPTLEGGEGRPRPEPSMDSGGGVDRAAVAEELGDLLFTVANLARKLEIDPEAALAAANRKFRRRFAQVEAGLAGRDPAAPPATLEEMDALWERAKAGE